METSLPSVEIICIGQREPIEFLNLPLAIQGENRLESHRSPKPHFQSDLDQLQGCIYLLLNPRLRDPEAKGAYTAKDLLIEWWDVVYFKPEFAPVVHRILQELLAASPEGRLLFTSDYQFGSYDPYRFRRNVTLETFWKRHDAKRLPINSSVQIVRSTKAPQL